MYTLPHYYRNGGLEAYDCNARHPFHVFFIFADKLFKNWHNIMHNIDIIPRDNPTDEKNF